MKVVRFPIKYLIAAACLSMMLLLCVHPKAEAELHWPANKKERLRIRLVALALSDPRSTFFAVHQVFVAEKDLGGNEWRLVKLVYSFLPYQPRLSDSGLDYSTVHYMQAVRDPSCDETLAHLTTVYETNAQAHGQGQLRLTYAENSPRSDLDRRRIPLPCYVTSADDYTRSTQEPINTFTPQLAARPLNPTPTR
jgi:hypothetical protein